MPSTPKTRSGRHSVGLIVLSDGDDESSDRAGHSHRMDGPKSCDHHTYRDCRHHPQKGAEMVRSHAEIESAKVREIPLDEGLSMRFGMGDMSSSIDDGVER